VTQNLAAAVGTATMGALVVAVLSGAVLGAVKDNPLITSEMTAEVDLDSINFLNNDRLKERFENTAASSEQIAEALRINSESRLRALKTGFLVLSSLSLLALVPCGWLPNYRPGEIPPEPQQR